MIGNPYLASASHLSQFPFASRSNVPSAPLFYSATDEFREEDDEEEREREVADFYALQRSRRQIGGSRLDESSEADDDGSRASGLEESGDGRNTDERGHGRGGGIKSSWRGGRISGRVRATDVAVVDEEDVNHLDRRDSEESGGGKGKMVDVGLDSTTQGSSDRLDRDEPPDDLAIEIQPDEDPPPMQQFRKPPIIQSSQTHPFLPQETEPHTLYTNPPPPESDASSTPPSASYPVAEPPRHDAFWGSLYLISLASLFASFFLVFLHTSKPSDPLGDTVYTTLHASFHLLAIDTVVAVLLSLLWLASLRSYVRHLVYTMLVAVPIILFSFSLYPLISSYRGPWHGASVQDKAMRWLSLIPGILSVFWTYTLYRGRHSLDKAIGILEFSCRILAANPALLALGFASLAAVIVWTWLWTAMFTRVFLGGHLSNAKDLFIIDASTWWLGSFFMLVYLWTLAVGSGIQRATTAATVSQWYFHRLSVPAPTSRQVVLAALSHSTTTLFGTISLSTLLALLIRLPFLLLPRRALALLSLCTTTLLPTPLTILTNPLTLTYAAIHSQPLFPSSRALAQMTYVFPSANRTFRSRSQQTSPLFSYSLALLLLRSTRFITSLTLGIAAWVSTARSLTLSATSPANTIKGSLYAYIIGLIAGAIGWGVLGAMDGVLTGVVDAVVVCWGSEVGRGEVRYCREAGWLFGDGVEGGEERTGFV